MCEKETDRQTEERETERQRETKWWKKTSGILGDPSNRAERKRNMEKKKSSMKYF